MSVSDPLLKALEPAIAKVVREKVRDELRALGIGNDDMPHITQIYFSPKEAAKYTGWSVPFLYELEDKGHIEFSRAGGNTSVWRSDLDRLMEVTKGASPRKRTAAIEASAAARRKKQDTAAATPDANAAQAA